MAAEWEGVPCERKGEVAAEWEGDHVGGKEIKNENYKVLHISLTHNQQPHGLN